MGTVPEEVTRNDTYRVVLGLGTNLGDRLDYLRRAAEALGRLSSLSMAAACLYESEPLGPDQPDFFNTALAIGWSKSLPELLLATQGIESSLGRVRTLRWGPRTIDIDLLWAEGTVFESPELSVPHRSLSERAFALLPLLDLFPDAKNPHTAQLYRDEEPRFQQQRIVKIAESEWLKSLPSV